MIKNLLSKNSEWAAKIKQADPDYFLNLSKQQEPDYLWIGCSDSRVPANQLVGTPPGQIFVHRNIANVVVHTDLNLLSVLQYAVDVLKVKHVIVCGHYGCGGVEAALANKPIGIIDHWLQNIKDIHQSNLSQFEGLSRDQQCKLLCELNVAEQVKNVAKTATVKSAWEREQQLEIHGWIYSIEDGLINDLGVTIDKANPE